MTKRLVDIDEEILTQAREALGTKTLKDTVNLALAETAARGAVRRALARDELRRFAEAAKDLGDPEVMARAWE